jgi:DNA sulfur modification protein DndD
MIFESVTVENWRGFYGEQTIQFATDKKRNTTIVYAQNGVGKTNLLNAIMWCLHGELTPSFKRPQDILNWSAKSEGRRSYHVSVYLRSDGDQLYKIKRSGGEISGFKVFAITDDGNHEDFQGNASLFVNSILPKDMAGYFINDGEGSDLTTDQNGMISVAKSIEDILGFKMAKKALTDIEAIQKEYLDQWRRIAAQGDVSADVGKVDRLKSCIEDEKGILEGNQSVLNDYEADLSRINTKLGSSSIPLIQAKQNARISQEKSLARAKSNLRELRNKKVNLIREYATAGFGAKLKDADLTFLDQESLKGKFPGDFNLQLVTDIIARKECLCGTAVHEGSQVYDAINALLNTAADGGTLDRLKNARAKITSINAIAHQIKGRIKDNFKNCDTEERNQKRIEDKLEELAGEINDSGVAEAKTLEQNRSSLKAKITATNQSIGRSQNEIRTLEDERKVLDNRIKNAINLSPQEEMLRRKIELAEEVSQKIKSKLATTMDEVLVHLESRIGGFMTTYLQQDYSISITEDKKIGLVDRHGNLVPPSKGQAAMLTFVYISTLVSIAREHRDVDTNILTAGAIAPLIFDAPFSDLQSAYALNVANTLPTLVDQLVLFMFQDSSKPIDKLLLDNGHLGRIACLTQHLQGPQKENMIETIVVDGITIKVMSYEEKRDRVFIEEIKSYG